MSSIEIEHGVKSVYDKQYEKEDPNWRDIGAKGKAYNLMRLCAPLNSTNLLDVGSGDGAMLHYLDQKHFANDLASIEISSSGIEKIKARNLRSLKDVKLYDGYTIPFNDKHFNLATSSHVLEHVEHPRILLREMARVSEYQYFEVPIDFSFFVDRKTRHFLDYGHINIFTPSLFKFLLKSEGFEIISEDYIFYSPEVMKMIYGKGLKLWIAKLKTGIVKAIPLFRKTKPNAYSVLCKHNGGIKIF